MISVIVPLYNASSTIERCINSIIEQSYQDWELLLINDGSTDDSFLICEKMAKTDNRIRLFNKSNNGVSSARNVGLNNAKGNLITFIDSDDYVKKDYLSNLLGHLNCEVDLVLSYAEIHGNTGFKVERYPSKLVTEENFDSIFIENDMHWHTSPWSKLYRKSIIEDNGLRFCEGMHIGEDALFLYSYMLCSKTLYISSDTDYCYFDYIENSLTKRTNSLSSELFSYSKIEFIIKSLIQKKNISNLLAINNLYWVVASYQRRILNALYHNKVLKVDRYKILVEMNWGEYIKYINADSVKEKILIFLLKNRLFWCYDIARRIAISIRG